MSKARRQRKQQKKRRWLWIERKDGVERVRGIMTGCKISVAPYGSADFRQLYPTPKKERI